MLDSAQRKRLKEKILARHALYKLYTLQYSRFRRILKDPLRLPFYFILQTFAHIRPFKITYATLWGDKMRFYLPEGGAIYYYGFFEANLTNFYINYLQPQDVFFDIGSHVGYYSILAKALGGEQIQVHAFEPTFRTFTSLQENVGGRQNTFCNNVAVFSKEGSIAFTDYGPKFSAFNSFKNRSTEEVDFLGTPTHVSVHSITIDSYRKDRDAAPTIIKIDAEGAEHEILLGMNETIATYKPLISIEVAGGNEWKENCKKSIDILQSYGYAAYEITLEGYLQTHTIKETYTYDNLMFVHPENKEKVAHLIITK